MVVATIETPQLRLDTVVNAPIMQVVQVFIHFVAPRLTPFGLDCSADHRDSPVAVRCQVVDVPVVDVYVQKTAEIPQLQLIYKGLYIPVVAQWPSPMVQTLVLTIQIPQSLDDKVVAAPVTHVAGRAGRRHSSRCTEADLHGPGDHGESPVSRGQGGRCPCDAGRQSPCCGAEAVPWSCRP